MPYIPNHVPKKERATSILISLALLAYGSVGFMVDDIYIPGKHSRGLHYHGVPCGILCAALLCASANLILVVIDHYDQRNNERHYKRGRSITKTLGYSLFFIALIVDLLIYHQST